MDSGIYTQMRKIVNSVLKVESISQTFFPGAPNEVAALTDVSLNLAQHDFVIVIGPNGSGKSCLLKAILEGQLIRGRIVFGDLDITDMPIHERSSFISYVTQSTDDGTISEFSILENLLLASFKTRGERTRRVDRGAIYDSVVSSMQRLRINLTDRVHSPVCDLSGGERQIIATLMALQGNPSLLVCDEPTASIDKTRALLIESLVTEYVQSRSIPVLWVTHDVEQALRLGNRILALKGGRIARDIGAEEKAKLSRESVLDLIQCD